MVPRVKPLSFKHPDAKYCGTVLALEHDAGASGQR